MHGTRKLLARTALAGGINYTGHLTRLMHDVVVASARAQLHRPQPRAGVRAPRPQQRRRPVRELPQPRPADERAWLLLLARPPHRRRHPPHRMVRHQVAGGLLRRTSLMNYMISFALPRFTDQTLSRSRKRALYPDGHAGLGRQARHGDSRALSHRSGAELPAPLHARRWQRFGCAAQRHVLRGCRCAGAAVSGDRSLTPSCSSSCSTTSTGCGLATAAMAGVDLPVVPVVSASLSRGRGRASRCQPNLQQARVEKFIDTVAARSLRRRSAAARVQRHASRLVEQ